MDVRPRRERLEETPFGRGQVLEAVRQDGTPVPGVELAGQAPDRIPAESAAIPCAEALELVPVPADETRERFGEIVRLDERAVDLGEGACERVREPRVTTARRVRVLDDAAEQDVPLGLAEQPPSAAVSGRERLEQGVERPDGARQEAVAARH